MSLLILGFPQEKGVPAPTRLDSVYDAPDTVTDLDLIIWQDPDQVLRVLGGELEMIVNLMKHIHEAVDGGERGPADRTASDLTKPILEFQHCLARRINIVIRLMSEFLKRILKSLVPLSAEPLSPEAFEISWPIEEWACEYYNDAFVRAQRQVCLNGLHPSRAVVI